MLAYNYPILGLFWTMLIFFFWVIWIIIVFRTIVDIFRNDEIGGFSKAFWLIFIVVVVWLGVLIYLIVHGKGMARRGIERQQAQQEAFDSYVRQTATASGGGTADELTKLADLHSRGVINDAEFASQKAKLLA